MPAAIPTHFVFPSERYGHMGQKGRTGVRGGILGVYKTFSQKPMGAWSSAWKKAKKNSGVHVRWRDLRHSFVSRIAASGVTDGTIQSIAGWMSPKMIERYSHIRNEAKRKAVTVFDTGVIQ